MEINQIYYINPIDPAVKPTTTKKANSASSLGSEFTIRFNWVIWPCAPQVYLIFKNITKKSFYWG